MKLEVFFERFDQFADAPDAVAKMRELVLDLAVHGNLVAQSDADEPANELLRRSRAEMANRMAAGQAKREEPAEPVSGEEGICPIPAGWTWCRLVDAGQFINGLAFKPSDWGSAGRPIIRIQNLSGRNPEYNRTTGTFDPSALVQDGDILVSWSATLDAFIWRGEEGVLNQHIFRVLPATLADKGFLFWLLKWVIRQLAESDHAHGLVMSHINRGPFLARPIPLPPLAEQKRIAAKVDELMELCDRLEAQQQEREAQHAALARASLARFAHAPTSANLPFLFHSSYDIPPADLRKSILALAVQGKLVPQDANDEPATILLARISRKKQAMIEAKQVRQGKVSRPSSTADAPTQLPPGWEWVNVDTLCFKVTDGTHFTPKYAAAGVRFVSAKDIVSGKLVFDRCKFITQEEHDQLYRRCNPEFHDIVISKSGSIGTVALVEDRDEFSLFESLALLKFDQESLLPAFLVCALTHACASLTSGHIRGVGVKHLHLDILRGLEMALPPVAEQRRIVAKMNQLMALVDELEAQLATAGSAGAALMTAVVAELTAEPDPC